MSEIVDLMAPNRWSHVTSADNPADCASLSVFPSELLGHELWWTGPARLSLEPSLWPKWGGNSVEQPVKRREKFVW